MISPRPESDDLPTRIAFASGLFAFLLTAAFLVGRAGFELPPAAAIARVVSLSLILLSLPVGIARYLERRRGAGEGAAWHSGGASLTLFLFFLLLALGFVCRRLGPIPAPLLVLLAAVSFAPVAFRALRSARWPGSLFTAAAALLFGVWLVAAAWGLGLQSPLFFEKTTLGGGHLDTLFHGALANVIATQGAPSTGLDGLPYLPYHYGAHVVVALLSSLLGLSVLDVLNFAFPVVFLPLSVAALGLFVFELRRLAGIVAPDGALFWVVLVVGHVGILPTAARESVGLGLNRHILSESYLLAGALFFLVAALLVAAWRSAPPDLPGAGGVPAPVAWPIVLPLATVLLGFAKISVAYLFLVAVGWLALRLGLLRRPRFLASLLLSALLVLPVYAVTNFWGGSATGLFGFLRLTVEPGWRLLFFPLYFSVSWCFVALRIGQLGWMTLGDAATALRERKGLDVELVLLLVAFGALPGLLVEAGHAATDYFSDFPRWVSLGLILALSLPDIRETLFPTGSGGWRGIRLRSVAAALLVAAFFGTSVGNVGARLRVAVVEDLEIRGEILRLGDRSFDLKAEGKAALASRNPARIEAFLRRVVAPSIDGDLTKHPHWPAIRALREIGALPLSERKGAVLLIPDSTRSFWTTCRGNERFASLFWSKSAPFLPPALTGVPLLRGVPSVIPYWIDRAELDGGGLTDDQRTELLSLYEPVGESSWRLRPDVDLAKGAAALRLLSGPYDELIRYYGYELHEKPPLPVFPDPASIPKAVEEARRRGFRTLFVLEEGPDAEGPIVRRIALAEGP